MDAEVGVLQSRAADRHLVFTRREVGDACISPARGQLTAWRQHDGGRKQTCQVEFHVNLQEPVDLRARLATR